MTALEYVKQRKIVAIVRGLEPDYLLRLGHAFVEGGIGLMELTYDQRASSPMTSARRRAGRPPPRPSRR